MESSGPSSEREGGSTLSRRKFVALAAATPVAGLVASVATGQLKAAAATVNDAFSAESVFETTDGWYAAPIHATVMPDASVFMMGVARDALVPLGSTPTRPCAWVFPHGLAAPLPAAVQVAPIAEPLDYYKSTVGSTYVSDNLFCAGHTLTADGLFFCVGGSRNTWTLPNFADSITGLPYGAVWNGSIFARVTADMTANGPTGHPYRWYPTVTRLTDGRLLVTAGFDHLEPTPSINRSVEIFDPVAGSWTIVSPNPHAPSEIFASDYTHVIVLPYEDASDVIMFGEPGIPAYLSVAGATTWTLLDSLPRPNTAAWQAARIAAGGSWSPSTAPGEGSATVMLPYRVNEDWGYRNGATVVAGGPVGSAWTQNIDIFDERKKAWWPTITAPVQRSNAALVLLPDGHLLRINGHSTDANIGRAELFDIANGMQPSIGTADSKEQRGYHNIAVLLPDGSVLVGGGRDVVTATSLEKPSFRFYYPPYMFAPNRPSLLTAPTTLTLGVPFTLAYAGATPPSDMVLIGLGSMTHQFDQNQRAVQVPVGHSTSGGNGHYTVGAVAPASSRIAPPGYYMLFALDGNRIPTKGAIVQVVAPAGGAATAVASRAVAGKPAWAAKGSTKQWRDVDPIVLGVRTPKPRVGPRSPDLGGAKPGRESEGCGG